MIPYEKWEEPKGTTRPLYLPGQVPPKTPKEAASRADPTCTERPDKGLAGGSERPAKGEADIVNERASNQVSIGAEQIAAGIAERPR